MTYHDLSKWTVLTLILTAATLIVGLLILVTKKEKEMNHRTFQGLITSCRRNPSYHYDSFVGLDCIEALNLII
jgi:hypothetical protein